MGSLEETPLAGKLLDNRLYILVLQPNEGCSLDMQDGVDTWAGMEMMIRCPRIDQAMMRYSPVGIPPEVSSLADEVDGPSARFHTSTTLEYK